MRFVVLEHFLHTPLHRDHYDLMFQQPSGALRTWTTRRPPDSSIHQSAKSTPDHRAGYLTYQGPTKRGGGWVRRWTSGQCRWLVQQDRCWRVLVDSPKLVGVLSFERWGDGGDWRYMFERR